MPDRRSYRDSDAFVRSQSGRRADGVPLWPLSQLGAVPATCAAEQRKEHAILMRRAAAAGEAMG